MSKASYRYPPDEFDAPPDPDAPRGVHRAPRSAWSRWWPFLAVLVIVPLVAWGAVTLLAQRGQLPDLPGAGGGATETMSPTDAANTQPTGGTPAATTPAPAPAETTPTAQPVLSTPVSVLNGAKISGLAGQVAGKLTTAGFTAVTTGNTTATTPAASTVFYGSDALKATADLVARTTGVTAVVLSPSDAPNGGVVVVLRSNPSA